MIAYVIRRLAYSVPILLGVNVITFVLFFVVNSPDDMARLNLGNKHVTTEAITKWKNERGYDKPLLWNAAQSGNAKLTDTIFCHHTLRLFAFDFGQSDTGRDIGYDISQRMWASLAITLPVFLLGLISTLTLALIVTFFRGTYIDTWAVIGCGRDDVDIESVLYHRRSVRNRQSAQTGPNLGFRQRAACI